MHDGILSFYDSLASDYHAIFADWRASVSRQAKVLDALLRAELGQDRLALLDCSCGIGTQALGLAAQGHAVTATDISPASVARAEEEAKAQGLSLQFGIADLRTLDEQVEGTFDAVLSIDNALPHLLSVEDLRQAANALYAKVRPGGLLLVSIRDYDAILKEHPSGTTPALMEGPEGRRVVFQLWEWLDDRTYDLSLFVLRPSDGGGSKEEWTAKRYESRYRALPRAELEGYLRDSGFCELRWRMPEETQFYQPILTARRGGRPSKALLAPITAPFISWIVQPPPSSRNQQRRDASNLEATVDRWPPRDSRMAPTANVVFIVLLFMSASGAAAVADEGEAVLRQFLAQANEATTAQPAAAAEERLERETMEVARAAEQPPKAFARQAAARLKAQVESFTLELQYHGPRDERPSPYRSLTLRTFAVRDTRRHDWPAVHFSNQQVTSLIDHLVDSGYFELVAHQRKASIAVPERHYTLSASTRDPDTRYTVVLLWDKEMFRRLEGLQAALEGKAAEEMKALLSALEPVRETVGEGEGHGDGDVNDGGDVEVGGGTLRLLEGFTHQPGQGKDSFPGTITRGDGTLVIHYDIGMMAGALMSEERKAECLWYSEQELGERKAAVGLVRRGGKRHLAVTITAADDDQSKSRYPGNFTAEVAGERDVAEVLLLALTYEAGPPPRRADAGGPITREDALRLATQAIAGKVRVPQEVKAEVTETEDAYIVTWPMELPRGVRRPDYHARVVIERQSGIVQKALGPS